MPPVSIVVVPSSLNAFIAQIPEKDIIPEDCVMRDCRAIVISAVSKYNPNHRVDTNIWETYFLIDATVVVTVSFAVSLRSTKTY